MERNEWMSRAEDDCDAFNDHPVRRLAVQLGELWSTIEDHRMQMFHCAQELRTAGAFEEGRSWQDAHGRQPPGPLRPIWDRFAPGFRDSNRAINDQLADLLEAATGVSKHLQF